MGKCAVVRRAVDNFHATKSRDRVQRTNVTATPTVPTRVHWDAVLVEAVRVDGTPRQRYVGCLCGIGQEIDSVRGATRRRMFWDQVMDRLHDLGALRPTLASWPRSRRSCHGSPGWCA
jgi:hypothetical protein